MLALFSLHIHPLSIWILIHIKWFYLLAVVHADSWFLYCCCFLCSNAASMFMGSWSADTINADCCGIQFDTNITFLSPSHSTHFLFLIPFIVDVSATSSIRQLHQHLSNLLYLCKRIHSYSNFDFPLGILCGCCYTYFHQDKVSTLIDTTYPKFARFVC